MLTPTQAIVAGKEGDWQNSDYSYWTQILERKKKKSKKGIWESKVESEEYS